MRWYGCGACLARLKASRKCGGREARGGKEARQQQLAASNVTSAGLSCTVGRGVDPLSSTF
jgi:hypothetical protein